ncbi:TonB-dependent receptor [soil metagenome]
MGMKRSMSLCLGASILALTAGIASQAGAQESTEVSEIVVTGTSIRGVAATGSPVTGVDQEQLKASGVASASEVAKLLPVVLNLGADEARNSFTGGAQDAAANGTAVRTVNLRGIGPEATLLLFNGRRLAPNGVIKALSDIDQVPAVALARIEVVADGASAIYGSDAVAGVVNLITRKNFDGAETSYRYGTADDLYQRVYSQTFGKTWDGGSAFFAYEHNERSHLSGADRPFASQDRRTRGGTDARPFTAAPGNIVISGVRYALPNTNGVGVSPASLVAGTANRYDEGAAADLLPAQERDTILFNVHHRIDDRLELWYEGFYSRRKFDLAAPAALFSLAVPNTNPWFVAPAGVTPASETVEYRFLDDRQPNSTGWENSQQNAVGFVFDVTNDWQMQGYFDHSMDRGFQSRQSVLNNTILTAALRSANPVTAFNPFGNGTFNRGNNAALVELIDGERNQYGTAISKDFQIKADGPLMALPAGSVRLAFGAEYHNNSFRQSLFATNVAADGSVTSKIVVNRRNVRGVFGELFIPLVGGDNALPGIERLDLSLAGRVEKYSDFGRTSNPKVGVVYSPFADLSLRATYGTSFRAPSLVDGADQIQNIFIQNLTDPTSGSGTTRGIFYNGGNSKLGPEEATTWSYGFDWNPSFLEGLRVSATYYKIDYTNRIDVVPNTALTNAAVYGIYATRRPAASDVAGNAAFNALIANFMTSPDLQNPVEAVTNINAIIDGRRQNLGSLKQDGLDVNIGYRMETGVGAFDASVDLAKIFQVKRRTAAGAPEIDVNDTFGNPVDLRVRYALGWSLGGFSAHAFANFVDSFKNTAVTPNVEAPSQTTYDATLSYAFPDSAPYHLDGVRLTLSAQNLTDEDPPVVLNGTVSWDSQTASAIGRMVAFEISKSW